jgi:tetratricopeptide (TPR) repeat protein
MLCGAAFVLGMLVFGFLSPGTVPAVAIVMLSAWCASVILGRDFFRGRAAMAARQYEEAIGSFDRFVANVSSPRGRIFKALWIGLYTSDPVAVALNNIGACYLGMRELDRALAPLEHALRRDAAYAIPHANLAILYRLLEDLARSNEHAASAVRLGYKASVLDATLRKALAAHNEAVGRQIR